MEMILDGVKLMVIGMLTVYIFLMIMVFCMSLMKRTLVPIAARFEKAPEKQPTAGASDDALRAAAAAVAFHENSK